MEHMKKVTRRRKAMPLRFCISYDPITKWSVLLYNDRSRVVVHKAYLT